LKIPTQAAKPGEHLVAPSMLTLIQPISGKYKKTYTRDKTLPILVLMSNYFKIEKCEIWLAICFLRATRGFDTVPNNM